LFANKENEKNILSKKKNVNFKTFQDFLKMDILKMSKIENPGYFPLK
jgi:hypothetical protein